MAKAIYLERNPGRQRIPVKFLLPVFPLNFWESIEGGSYYSKLVLITAMSGLFPTVQYRFLRQLWKELKTLSKSPHLNQDFTDILPNQVLNCFNQLGKQPKKIAYYFPGTRQVLLLYWTKKAESGLYWLPLKQKSIAVIHEIRGIITALDKERKTF